MKDKIIRGLKNPELAALYFLHLKIARVIPDAAYLKMKYRLLTGKRLNFKNPRTFNEKLQWLKINDRKPEYKLMVDKYKARQFVSAIIGDDYLIPLIGVYDNAEEINWDVLPQKFVLKCTHSSGRNIICTDKAVLDKVNTQKRLNKWLKEDWFWIGREWPYKDIKPRIVCESFISDGDSTPNDYKVLCFHGKARLIQLHIDRYGNHTQDYYDDKWNKLTISQLGTTSEVIYEKPPLLEKMIGLSEKLAENMAHLRVDWYMADGKLYFGELTLYDASGFDSFDDENDEILMGSWISLGKE